MAAILKGGTGISAKA